MTSLFPVHKEWLFTFTSFNEDSSCALLTYNVMLRYAESVNRFIAYTLKSKFCVVLGLV